MSGFLASRAVFINVGGQDSRFASPQQKVPPRTPSFAVRRVLFHSFSFLLIFHVFLWVEPREPIWCFNYCHLLWYWEMGHDTVENLRKSLLLKGQLYGVDPARFFRVIGFFADADDIQTWFVYICLYTESFAHLWLFFICSFAWYSCSQVRLVFARCCRAGRVLVSWTIWMIWSCAKTSWWNISDSSSLPWFALLANCLCEVCTLCTNLLTMASSIAGWWWWWWWSWFNDDHC